MPPFALLLLPAACAAMGSLSLLPGALPRGPQRSRASRRYRMMDNGPRRPRRHAALDASLADLPAPRYLTQRQDHFDSDNENRWQQAYYVNDTFWKPGSAAPVFLCVGGEGPPLDGSAVVASEHCNDAVEWLPETGALMFALEHRYYGCHNMSACPVASFEDKAQALKHLASRQAIEDIANFIYQMSSAYGLTGENKWVTWGGSYPGMLSGWSRLAHPELIHASVASSAPVHAKLDMQEYYDFVAHAYTVVDNDVGGSYPCMLAIKQAHETAGELLRTPDGQAGLEKRLGLQPGDLAKKADQLEFFGNGAANFPAQSNDPLCTEPGCNIKSICEIMTNTSISSDALDRLLALREAQAGWAGWSEEAPEGEDPPPQDTDLPDFWFYQTCTEFGFYQTCEVGSQCMFLQGLDTLDSQVEECASQFDIAVSDIQKSIDATNVLRGGVRPLDASADVASRGTLGKCVLWTNGEVDPWASLSVLLSPGAKQPTLWVPGAAHHWWTHPSTSDDQPSVQAARASIRKQVAAFLADEDCRPAKAKEAPVEVL